ncbi:MAG: thymidine kinase [Armatimonadota bacterium]|nr:thymidine kinase [bacterium]MDW8321625.1 thymidine kinase [Armatimonadota bacterium]
MRKQVGTLIVITGSMFAGKSEELIRQVRRALYARKKVQVFKSALDNRWDSAAIATHNGVRFEAIPVSSSAEMERLIEPDTEVIAIEEIQFFDEGVVNLCNRWANEGRTVIAAGLDQDFRGQPFGFMPILLALADEVVKLRAICARCGQPASKTQRLVDGRPASWDEPTILIGAAEKYEARCRRCHRVLNAPRNGHRRARRAHHIPTVEAAGQQERLF